MEVKTALHLVILWLQNIAELFPHLVIPFIFWYLPAKNNSSYKTIFVLLPLSR